MNQHAQVFGGGGVVMRANKNMTVRAEIRLTFKRIMFSFRLLLWLFFSLFPPPPLLHVFPACCVRYAHGCSAVTQWPLNRGGGGREGGQTGSVRHGSPPSCRSLSFLRSHTRARWSACSCSCVCEGKMCWSERGLGWPFCLFAFFGGGELVNP